MAPDEQAHLIKPTPPRIIVGIDGSESDEPVVTWGAHEAHRRATGLLIVHAQPEATAGPVAPMTMVSSLGAAKNFGVELLAEAKAFAGAAQPGVEVTTVTRQQKPEELLRELSLDAQLVVVGTHGLGRFIGALLGSVSQRLAAHAYCPVVVLPPPGAVHPGSAARTVVVGVSPSVGGISALRFALAEAQLRDAEVLALRAWSEPAIYGMGSVGVGFMAPAPFETVRESQQELLDACLQQVCAEFPTVPVRSKLLESAADVALVDYSRDADLLVVGCRHEDGYHLSRLGPVTSWLLHNSAVPIVVVGFAGAGLTSSPSHDGPFGPIAHLSSDDH